MGSIDYVRGSYPEKLAAVPAPACTGAEQSTARVWTELDLPMKGSRERDCLCGKKFSRCQQLREHVSRDHLRTPLYKCAHCDKTFTNKTGAKWHERAKHFPSTCYECRLCNSVDYRRSSMLHHVRRRHGAPVGRNNSANWDDFFAPPRDVMRNKTRAKHRSNPQVWEFSRRQQEMNALLFLAQPSLGAC